jgi:hypothetical protein
MAEQPVQPEDEFLAPPENDPVLGEIRARRRRLWEESGRNIRRYIEQSEKREERRRQQERAAAGGERETE